MPLIRALAEPNISTKMSDSMGDGVKMNKPVGDAIYGPLFIRLALGGYLLMAGMAKLENIPGFIEEVQAFNFLPEHLATLYGILMPYLEVISGGMILLGMWTTLAAILGCVIITSFVFAFGVFPYTSKIFNKDLILLGASLSLMYTGAGAFSVDRFRATG